MDSIEIEWKTREEVMKDFQEKTLWVESQAEKNRETMEFYKNDFDAYETESKNFDLGIKELNQKMKKVMNEKLDENIFQKELGDI